MKHLPLDWLPSSLMCIHFCAATRFRPSTVFCPFFCFGGGRLLGSIHQLRQPDRHMPTVTGPSGATSKNSINSRLFISRRGPRCRPFPLARSLPFISLPIRLFLPVTPSAEHQKSGLIYRIVELEIVGCVVGSYPPLHFCLKKNKQIEK